LETYLCALVLTFISAVDIYKLLPRLLNWLNPVASNPICTVPLLWWFVIATHGDLVVCLMALSLFGIISMDALISDKFSAPKFWHRSRNRRLIYDRGRRIRINVTKHRSPGFQILNVKQSATILLFAMTLATEMAPTAWAKRNGKTIQAGGSTQSRVFPQRDASRNRKRLSLVSTNNTDALDKIETKAHKEANKIACAFTATKPDGRRLARFDSDSFVMAVDNCCTKCVTNCMADFVGPTESVNTRITGVGGIIPATVKGTVHWTIEPDRGMPRTFVIKDVLYNKDVPYRLFSPQHVAELEQDDYPKPDGTWCATYKDRVVLYWNQRQQSRTIPLDPITRIALVRGQPGFNKFSAFCAAIEPVLGSPLDSVVGMITEHHDTHECVAADEQAGSPHVELLQRRHPDLPDSVFDNLRGQAIVPPQLELPEPEEMVGLEAKDELLAWHYRTNHLPFDKLRKMAQIGKLPAHLAKCAEPMCATCMYGKPHRAPWRHKPKLQVAKRTATYPGELVSIDQLISPTPGLVAQMKGFLTHDRYTAVTVFVDHYSNAGFTYYQKSATIAETLEAKAAFERFATKHGVSVKAYRADNGVFETASFTDAVHNAGQTIEYCAVGAHHQNGKAEKKIRDLQEMARCMLLHAAHRWPTAVNANLWPYAIRLANETLNSAPKY
jgi:hypothetical protein